MKKRIEVRTQVEFDACVKAGNIAICVGGGFFVARGNSSVEAWGNSSVEAWGNSSVVAWENSSVEAWGNSSVVAWGNSSVVAWENSSVEARGNSSVVARENSSVEAWENSSVEAWGNVFLRIFSALRIKASAYVAIMVQGPVQSPIEGGRQMQPAPVPTNGAEWCEYLGVKLDAPFKVENIDAKILAAIEAGQGSLNMATWHGEKCTAENWCGTTHCRAGYAICLAGKSGFELERKYGAEMAGKMIYAVSRPTKDIPNFMATNSDAMDDMRACAAESA